MLERESFKLVLACFLKLSFFCVFVGDFCSPPRSSGLAPNKGHEKRWHLGMARLLHGRTGHWWLCEHVSSAFKRHSSGSGFLQPPERTMGNPSRFYSGRSHGMPWMSRVVDGVNPPTPLTLNRANETSVSHHPY